MREALLLHQAVTRNELHDWIVEEVRRRPDCTGFAVAFTFVRLPTPDAQGRTWRVQSPVGEHTWAAATVGAFETAVRHAQRAFDLIESRRAMGLTHQNLAVVVGAAKDQARALVLGLQRRGSVLTGRSSSVYLSLVVMHQQLLALDPPLVAHFVPDLEQIARACRGTLAPVKPLIEAALRVARDAPDAP